MSNDRRYTIGGELRARGTGNDLTIKAKILEYGALSCPGIVGPGTRERFRAGSLARYLRSGGDVIGVVNHDPNQILGRLSQPESMQLRDTETALFATLHLLPNVQAHKDIWALAKAGLINSCSFSFSCVRDSWSSEKDPETGESYQLRTVLDADLHDVSILSTTPAYPDVTAVMARSYRLAPSVSSSLFGPQGEYLPFVFRSENELDRANRAKLAEITKRLGLDCESLSLREKLAKVGEQSAADIQREKFKDAKYVKFIQTGPNHTGYFEPMSEDDIAEYKRQQSGSEEDWLDDEISRPGVSAPLSARTKE